MENTKGSRLFVRIPAYVIGLLIMTLGVAISVKSNLGVSPVSSIPYTITCVVGLEMGKATILFHAVEVKHPIKPLPKPIPAKKLFHDFCRDSVRIFHDLLQFADGVFPRPDKSHRAPCHDAVQYGVDCLRAVLVCPCGYHSAGRGGSNACHLQDH